MSSSWDSRYLNYFVFSAFGRRILGSLFPRPGRLLTTSGANNASFRLFAEANRKENITTLPNTVINYDISAGRPDSESPRSLLARARKSKIHLESKLFSQLFSIFSSFLMKFGELSDFSSIFVVVSGLFFGF